MKKIMFLIASVLAVGTACITAGCHGNQGGPDTKDERNYEVQQQDIENETPEEDKDCKDGGCENKNLHENIPEFKFKPHRHYKSQDDDKERETENDNGGNEDTPPENIEPRQPHKMRPHKNKPAPKPMPVKPR